MLPHEDEVVKDLWPQVRDAYNRAERLHDFVVAEFFDPELKIGTTVNTGVMTTAMGLLAKACKTHRAVEIVALNGLGEDGMTLARSSYETAMVVLFILNKDSETRNAMYVTHMIHQKLKMFNSWATTPTLQPLAATDEVKELKARTEELLAKWQKKVNGADVKDHWSGKNSLAAAAQILDEDTSYHFLYREMSPHAHATDLFDHLEHQDDGPSLVNLLPSAASGERCLELSDRFLWAIASKINEAWKLGLTSRLETFKPQDLDDAPGA